MAPHLLRHGHLAVQQHVEELRRLALVADDAVRRVLLDRPAQRQPGQLLVVEVLEEEQLPQFLR
ncbi:hypothetical protein LUX33_00865 [Actinomadura madurae]|uniref:hypothetical protein n=1 Tax=Actinomadura madurae TaxID=1993 RepID=UPI0020D21333|nr:hypothetical protein [Actinomadura madurae]MCP9947148.1 hypothetical protein [Actinomadura madurae]